MSIAARSRLLGVARTNAYNKPRIKSQAALDAENHLKKRIDYWHTMMPYIGTRKLRRKLQDTDGIIAGRKLIRRCMAEMGIRTVYPKPNLSAPAKDRKPFPYLLKNMAIYLPNQVWALDITYIPLRQGHMYLIAIIDWHSRFIVGWALSDTLESAPVTEAVTAAIERYGVPGIINSDQGSQFTGALYTKLLVQYHVRQSMDGKARWVDNVVIERWFRSLKTERIYINEYDSPRALRVAIGEYVEEYNRIRPHQALDYKTPYDIFNQSFGQDSA